jgi:hypothetical protein
VSLSLVQWRCDYVSLLHSGGLIVSLSLYSGDVIMSPSLIQWRCDCVSVSWRCECVSVSWTVEV